MSKSSKIILGIVIIIAIGLIAWCFFGTTSPVVAPVVAPLSTNASAQSQGAQLGGSNVPVAGLTTSSSDNSDAALNSDISVISSQSAALDQDSAAAQATSSATQ